MNRIIKYSIFPLYGDAAVIVTSASSLLDAIQSAFDCRITKIESVYTDGEFNAKFNDTWAFYGIVSALGSRSDRYSVLCSAAIITYEADDARKASDLESIKHLIITEGK